MRFYKKKQPETCGAEELAKRIRKQRGLPDDAIVPLLYLCPCRKCRPSYTC